MNLDQVEIDGRASFSRAKIDGMWILTRMVEPEQMKLDMRFAHIWVIKDEKLDDWPPAGQLQLEGLVYDHFDDDSPLSVDDRLAWLRRQYAPHARRSARISRPRRRRRTAGSPSSCSETVGQAQVRSQETRAQQARPWMPPVEFEGRVTSPPVPSSTSSVPAPSMARAGHDDATARRRDDRRTPRSTPIASSDPDDGRSIRSKPKPAADSMRNCRVRLSPPRPCNPPCRPIPPAAVTSHSRTRNSPPSIARSARTSRPTPCSSPAPSGSASSSPTFSAQGLWYRYLGRLIGYGYEPFRAIKIGVAIVAYWRDRLRNRRASKSDGRNQAGRARASRRRTKPAWCRPPTRASTRSSIRSTSFCRSSIFTRCCYWIPGERLDETAHQPQLPDAHRPVLAQMERRAADYLWFQTLAGWTLCTLLAAAVTGIVES